MKRYIEIAKLGELRNLCVVAQHFAEAAKCIEAIKRLVFDEAPEGLRSYVFHGGELIIGNADCGVVVKPNLAHGFELEITGAADENEIGEIFSKWLNEEAK